MYKHIITIILLLLPLIAMPQSHKSNQLYKKGEKLFDAEKYEEAVPYFQKSDSLDKTQLEPTSENYYRAELKMADCYEELAVMSYYNDKYSEAIKYQTFTIEIRKKILGDEHPEYAESLSDLGVYYNALGNTAEAIRLGTVSLEIYKNTLGKDSPKYAVSLACLAHYQNCIGNYNEAIRLLTLAIKIFKKTVGENDVKYAISLDNLANYNCELGNYQEAIRLGTQAMETFKKVLGEEHPAYARSLHNLAAYNHHLGNYQEAIKLCTEAMEIKKKVLGENHPGYATTLHNLAMYTSHLGNYQEAIRLGTKAMEIYKKALGEEHPYYAMSLRNLAECYLGADNYNYAVDYYKRGYERTVSFILKNFSWMTNRERTDFWNMSSDFFSNNLSRAAYTVETSYYGVSTPSGVSPTDVSTITALAYDSQIFSKGLLLNAELEIQKLIEQSGDTTFANRYYKIRQDRAILDGLYQTSPENREMDADSLAKVIENEERLLVESSKELGDYTKNLAISWRDVQNNLKDNDLAIEFATVNDTAAKQLVYVAFVLKKGMTAPEIVKLFNTDDFYGIKTNEYYTSPKLYNLVWQPLSEYLKDAKTVYFSPAGQIHTIGVEYLSGDDGKIFAEKYDTYRLSSTRELAMTHTINTNRKATTYGGIQYEFSEDEWRSLRDVNDSIERSFRDIPQVADNMRGGGSGMAYLDGTKLESAAIANLLRSANYNVSALSDAAATEESFKMLSGSGIKILHIGTHGFYENASDMENAGYKFYMAASQQTNEERSLSCSGLLFAGANSALDPRRVKEISPPKSLIKIPHKSRRIFFLSLYIRIPRRLDEAHSVCRQLHEDRSHG